MPSASRRWSTAWSTLRFYGRFELASLSREYRCGPDTLHRLSADGNRHAPVNLRAPGPFYPSGGGRAPRRRDGRSADAREDLAGEDRALLEPVGEPHPEVEDEEVAADLLVAADVAHDVVDGAGEGRAPELLDAGGLALGGAGPTLL